MSNDEIILMVGALVAIVLGVTDIIRTDGQSLVAWGLAVLGAAIAITILI